MKNSEPIGGCNEKNNILILLTTATALISCHWAKKEETVLREDCSTIFEDSRNDFAAQQRQMSMVKNMKETSYSEFKPTECKILPIKFSKESKCEIAGSNKIDNLLEFYSQNTDEKTIIILPLEEFLKKEIGSFKGMMIYSKVSSAIQDRLNSEVFQDLEDFRYKGLNCDISGQKFTTWIGDGRVVISIDEREIKAAIEDNDKKNEQVTVKKKIKKSAKQVSHKATGKIKDKR